jgi:sugar phosphate permease
MPVTEASTPSTETHVSEVVSPSPVASEFLTWALGSLNFEQRGRGTGCWTAAVFLGQFICPLVVLALSDVISGLGSALVVVGVLAVAVAVGVRVRRPVVTGVSPVGAH